MAGPSPTRKWLATLVVVVGLVVVGAQLARVWPRDVEVVYQADPGTNRLDVEVLRDGEAVKSARFTRSAGDARPFVHTISLQPGEYQAHITAYGPEGHGVEHSQRLVVPGDGSIRLDLQE